MRCMIRYVFIVLGIWRVKRALLNLGSLTMYVSRCGWQSTVFAPLFDTKEAAVRGVICASDFITTLQQLSSSNPLSEAEMDQHTIRGLLGYDSAPVAMDYVEPEDSLQHVVNLLLNNARSMVPIVIINGGKIQEVLHNATLGGTYRDVSECYGVLTRSRKNRMVHFDTYCCRSFFRLYQDASTNCFGTLDLRFR